MTKCSHFYGFCHRNMVFRLTKMAKKYTLTPLFFYNKHFESKNKQYACCSSLFNVYTFLLKLSAMLAAILDFSDRTMMQANHPRFSCTSDMSLTIYGIIFSGPLMHTDTPSGTGVFVLTSEKGFYCDGNVSTWFVALCCWVCMSHLNIWPCKICLNNKPRLTMISSNIVKEIL